MTTLYSILPRDVLCIVLENMHSEYIDKTEYKNKVIDILLTQHCDKFKCRFCDFWMITPYGPPSLTYSSMSYNPVSTEKREEYGMKGYICFICHAPSCIRCSVITEYFAYCKHCGINKVPKTQPPNLAV